MTHCTTGRFLLRLPRKSRRSPLTSPHLVTQVYRLLVQMYVSLASIILLSSQHNTLILKSTSVLVYCPGNIHYYVLKKDYLSKFKLNLLLADMWYFTIIWLLHLHVGEKICFTSDRIIVSNSYFEIIKSYVSWSNLRVSSVQSVAQSCATLCDPMNCSTTGLPAYHQLPEFTKTCPSSQWCHPAISSSVVPFSSCPQSLR